MSLVRFLHAADLHLDAPLGGRLSPQLARLRRQELKEALLRLTEEARRRRVHLLLLAGDLFEAPSASPATVQFLAEAFRRIPETQVFIAPGNHDPVQGHPYYRFFSWPENVFIFAEERWTCRDLPALGVTVWGLGFTGYEVREPWLQKLRVPADGRFHLVLVHAADTSAAPGRDCPYLPFTRTDLEATGAGYVALGHYHCPRLIRRPGGSILAAYPGSPEPLGFDEPGTHGAFYGCIAEGKLQTLEFVPLARRRYITRQVEITGLATLDQVAERLQALDDPATRSSCFYALTLVGEPDPDLIIDAEELRRRLAGKFAHLEVYDRSFPAYDLDLLSRERTARGLFIRCVRQRLAREKEEERRLLLQRALLLGLDALSRGEVRPR
ncbi:MAG: DNA repair exonuclease [Bacillota bacterium]|nr:DNA repair exonuclease [Bacillota bacterium]